MRARFAALALSLVAVAGCASPAAAPVFAPSGPAAAARHVSCTYAAGSAANAHGLVTVDEHPDAVSATWYPGLNIQDCQDPTTTGPAARAARLAEDIRRAPRIGNGVYNCPADLEVGVLLSFRYPNGRAEVVYLSLTGCPSVTAPGRAARWLSQRLRIDLRPLAPTRWLRYL